jgi:hypothetical protein
MLRYFDRDLSPRCPCCFIVPPDVLKRYSQDGTIDDAVRRALGDTYAEVAALRSCGSRAGALGSLNDL